MSKKNKVLKELEPLYILIDPETWEECGETNAKHLMEAWGCTNLQQIEKCLDRNQLYDGCIIIEDYEDGYFQELDIRKERREKINLFTEDSQYCYYVTNRDRVFKVTKDDARAKTYLDIETDGIHNFITVNGRTWDIEDLKEEKFSVYH